MFLSPTNQRNQRGYTLIELLLYVTIVGVLLTAVAGFYAVALDARAKNQAVSEVNQQATLAIDQITQTIRNASAITSPAAATSASTLTLTVPTASLSPTVYSLNSTALQIVRGTGTAVSLTGSRVRVSSLTFTNLTRSGTNGIIRINLTLAYANNSGRNQYDYSKTFTTSAEVGW